MPYDADWEFPVKRLIIQGVIGSGTFGQVMKAEAVGVLSFSARDKTSDAFKRRSRLRRRLSSSRIYQDSAGNDYTRTTVAVKMLKGMTNNDQQYGNGNKSKQQYNDSDDKTHINNDWQHEQLTMAIPNLQSLAPS